MNLCRRNFYLYAKFPTVLVTFVVGENSVLGRNCGVSGSG